MVVVVAVDDVVEVVVAAVDNFRHAADDYAAGGLVAKTAKWLMVEAKQDELTVGADKHPRMCLPLPKIYFA